MDNKFIKVRRQKHIWQIAFIILAVVVFVQTFMLYKDNPNVASKIKGIFSSEYSSTLEVERFLKEGTVRTNPIEMNGMAQPTQGIR